MLDYSFYSDSTWLYPDSEVNGIKERRISIAKNGHAAMQLLIKGDEKFSLSIKSRYNSVRVKVFKEKEVCVNENTAPTLMTTLDWEACKDYATRKAPFYVYDALLPIADTSLHSEKTAAFFLEFEALPNARSGVYKIEVEIRGKETRIKTVLELNVINALLPSLCDSGFGIFDFLSFDNIAKDHHADINSKRYWNFYKKHVELLLEMRVTHIMLPTGVPVYSEDNQLSGFDFSACEKAGNIAVSLNAPYIVLSPISHWKEWDDSEYYAFWNQEKDTSDEEVYFELSKYFSALAAVVKKNKWQGRLCLSLADEPQSANCQNYRILSAIARKYLPEARIIEAIEATNLGGSLDIWVPKQETFEQNREKFRRLCSNGEEVWFYTCAFPAGKAMNRSMDLPLSVSRLVLWMAVLYGLSGYLHWGWNFYIGPDVFNSGCCPHKGALLPAGDAHIVYPLKDTILRSARYEVQKLAAEEVVLMKELERRGFDVHNLVSEVSKDYMNYSSDGEEVARIREKIFSLSQ